MSNRRLFVAGMIFLGVFAGASAFAGEAAPPAPAGTSDAAANRDPAATDQVFTPAYMDQVNAAQQAADEQKRQDQERHDKLIDQWMRGF